MGACRGKRGTGTKDNTEGKVSVKGKEDSTQLPIAFPKEVRIKEKGKRHCSAKGWKWQLSMEMGKGDAETSGAGEREENVLE